MNWQYVKRLETAKEQLRVTTTWAESTVTMANMKTRSVMLKKGLRLLKKLDT